MRNRDLTSSLRAAGALALLWALLPACPAPAAAQEAAAVLAKGSGLYFDAYLAFQKALGKPLAVFDLADGKPRLPAGLKTAAAFGNKAATADYPSKTALIVLLAPGYVPPPGRAVTIVSPLPAPALAAAAFKKAQPALKRLAVFHAADRPPAYLREFSAAARRLGVEVNPVQLAGPGGIPDALRALQGAADAFWLLPEPSLINKTSLSVLAKFSCASKLPFYAPSPGISELGAAAAFAPDLAETAAAAAELFKRAQAGEKLPGGVTYVPRSRLSVNEAFVRDCGLPLDIKAASEVNR